MENVYLWKAGDKVIHHTDIEAAAQLDGLVRQPDKTVSEAEFEAANGLVRIIEGEIVLGQTDDEKADGEKQEKIAEIQARFTEIDRLDGPRPIREAVAQLAHSAGLDTSYLMRHEAEVGQLRSELAALSA